MWTLNFDSGIGQSASASSVRSVPTTHFGYAYGSDRTSHTASGEASTCISFLAMRLALPGRAALDAALEVLDGAAAQGVLDDPGQRPRHQAAGIQADLHHGPGPAVGAGIEPPAGGE